MSTEPSGKDIKNAVKRGYAEALQRSSGCCSSTSGAPAPGPQALGYSAAELATLPEGTGATCFGCGNPLASGAIRSGDVVLDIGSGAGMDCLLAASQVGPGGRVIGLDMTPEMVKRGNENARKAGAANVEFRLGDAEAMPLEDACVDLVISNCVINLAPDKPQVFREVARVLRPGGRVSISDIVFADELPELPRALQANMELVVACIGGAVREGEYLEAMRAAGLGDLTVVERTLYPDDQIAATLESLAGELGGGERLHGFTSDLARAARGKVWSARITARKPPTDAVEVGERDPGAIIRPATAADFADIVHLLTTCELPSADIDLDRQRFLIAREGTRAVGCIGLERHGSSALLRSLAVAPDRRSRGIAGRLAEAMLDRARAGGARQAVILTQTIADWAARRGFVAVPRSAADPALAASAEWGADCCASATCMVLPLQGDTATPPAPLPVVSGSCCSC